MIRTRQLVMAALVALAGCGNEGETTTRTIPLAHIDPDQAMLLVEPYLAGASMSMRKTTSPQALTLSGPPERVEQIAQLLKQADQPAPRVQLRFQIVEADGFTTTDSAIADVEAALRELFRFRGYRLGAEAMVSGQAENVLEQTVLLRDQIPVKLTVEVPHVRTGSEGKAVEMRITMWVNGVSSLSTAVTVPSGQTVVLGSARPLPNVGTLILVVRPLIE